MEFKPRQRRGAESSLPQRDRLVKLAASAELWHTPGGETFASMPVGDHFENWPLRSKGFRRWLGNQYRVECHSVPSGKSFEEALCGLDAIAAIDGAGFESPRTDYTKMLVSAIPRVDAASRAGAAAWTGADRQPLLRVERLSFAYRPRFSLGALLKAEDEPPAVDDVSFAIESGEVLGLVGESGSGKSTVANVICGLLTPTSGDVVFDGRPINRSARHRPANLKRRIQIIFQDPLSSLNPRRRIESILARPLEMFFGLK
ncbi:MAG: ATP-binding cassette domain-containing protein, partial [Alphaproteobacteria bacterium]